MSDVNIALSSIIKRFIIFDIEQDSRGGIMTNTTVVSKDKLNGIFDIDNLTGTTFKVTIMPISEDEADEIEFKSLKGIAGRPLDLDEVREERLGL